MIAIRRFKTKKAAALVIALILCISMVTACSAQSADQSSSTSQADNATTAAVTVNYDKDDLNAAWDDANATHIILKGDSITTDGTGVNVADNKVTIQSGGTYVVSGTLNDGQILVYNDTTVPVRLVLNGVDITCSTSAPIYVLHAEKMIITLADGTENNITDGDSYALTYSEDEEPNAAIFSKSDLTINGNGLLRVDANCKNAITSKDGLKIVSGTIAINSVNNGITGRDYIAVKSGYITVKSEEDGMKSTNDEDSSKGFVLVEGGTIKLTAGGDGIQAETCLLVKDGNIAITSGGGSVNTINKSNLNSGGQFGGPAQGSSSTSIITDSTASDSTDSSMKGLKAGADLTISSGTVTIDSADDAIHTNGSLTINDGTIKTTSGDDGFHADATITINNGKITIAKSYEGIESAVVTINDGTIYVTASDDGINVAGGNDSSSVNGRTGQNQFADTGVNILNINGGYLSVDSGGDGLDSNGSITMTDGLVLVNGPINNGNGAIDYNGTFNITGGFLAAAGSAGMAEAPGTSSELYSLNITFSSNQQAGTMVHIANAQGEDILTFVPTKNYQNIVLSSSELKQGEAYTVYVGGSSTGTSQDGLYSGGTYTAGNQYTDLTISDKVTSVGSSVGKGASGMGQPAGGDRGTEGGFRPRN